MKGLLLSLALVYILAIQLSYQQDFKPQKQVTGPYGRSSGRRFNFDMDNHELNKLPSSMVTSHDSGGIRSLSFIYLHLVGKTVAKGGKVSGGITETDLGRIVGAEVCTGTRSRQTVIIGLKFTYEDGISNYFHGDTSTVSGLNCVNAAPKTPGYYLQSVSGRYGDYINQVRFYWVSNFEQELACRADPNCLQEFDFCPSDDCCYHRNQNENGEWEKSAECA